MTTTIAFVNWASPQIAYSGNWSTYGGSQHKGTPAAGSSFKFDFNGSQVWVAGTLYPLQGNPPWAVTFTVDGQAPTELLTGPDVSSDQVNVGLWGSKTLSSNAQHQVVVEVTSATANSPFLFDEILFLPFDPTPTSTPSEVTYSATSLPVVTVTVSAVPDGKGVPTGAIVGGVVAGLTLLAVAGILVLFCLRRRRQGKAYFYDTADAAELLNDEPQPLKTYTDDHRLPLNPTVSSYGVPMTAYSQSEYSQSSYTPSAVHPTSPEPSPSSFSGGRVVSVAGSNPPHAITPYQPSLSSSTGGAGSKAAEAGLLSVAPQPQATFHADSGIRFTDEPTASGSGVPTDVPPSYTPN